jgi:hypothetical protein
MINVSRNECRIILLWKRETERSIIYGIWSSKGGKKELRKNAEVQSKHIFLCFNVTINEITTILCSKYSTSNRDIYNNKMEISYHFSIYLNHHSTSNSSECYIDLLFNYFNDNYWCVFSVTYLKRHIYIIFRFAQYLCFCIKSIVHEFEMIRIL